MKQLSKVLCQFFIGFTILLTASSVWAPPIRSFLSVPLAKGGWGAQMRYAFSHFSDGPLSLDFNFIAPFFNYGITDRVGFITLFPILVSDFDAPAGGPVSSSNEFGLGDIPLLTKVDIFRKHLPTKNFGISLVGGLEIPSGDNPFSSNSVDFPFALVLTFQGTGNELDADFAYQINTEGNGIDAGDQINYDVAYSRRLLPWKLPDQGEPGFVWNIIMELNGVWVRQGSLEGVGSLPDTGGNTLFFLPGFMYIFKDWFLQTGVQIPIYQDLNGLQLENKYNVLVNFGTSGAFF